MLQSAIFDDIKTMAFRHPLVGAPGIGFHGGPVIISDDRQQLRHTRYFQPSDWFDGHEGVTVRLPGQYVYAGPAYNHFGHVMAEMVHRLLPSQHALAGRKLLLVSTLGDTLVQKMADLPGFMQEVLSFFSITPEQITILNADRVVENVFVAQQGSDFGGGPQPDYLDLLSGFAERLLSQASGPRHERVYVSRSGLPGGGGFLGESYVEQALEHAGFFVARPEVMTLLQQMWLYNQAKVLVFPEGSACHGVELLGPCSLGTVILLARREDHMEIFARVLAPRAKAYKAFPPTLGTISVFRTMKHMTVGHLAHRELFSALQAD